LLIFTVLFASADLVFNNLVSGLFNHFQFGDIIGHIVLTAVLGMLFMGGLTYALIRPLNLFKVTASAPKPAQAQEASPSERDKADFVPAAAPTTSVSVPNIKGALGALEAFIV